MEKKAAVNRRDFLKTVGAAGLGSMIGADVIAEPNKPAGKKEKQTTLPQVPRKVFRTEGGKEITVPALSHGLMFNVEEAQIVLHKGLEWGVNYWDTSNMYVNGKSEEGIGIFLKKNPEVRKNVFIVSKASGAKTSADRDAKLDLSLQRMNTDYIDLYYGVHGMEDPKELTDELGKWAKAAKKSGKIKYFGFSAHVNMAKILAEAVKKDWIDGVMITYNFTFFKDKALQDAIDACHKKGIALIAMKTQAKMPKHQGAGQDTKIVEHFESKGYTEGQAKIKAVMQDPRICSVCVGMKNIKLLTENVAAALDKTKLSQADFDVMENYAKESCSGYCKGCAEICKSVTPQMPYVAEVMRYMMYHNSYGDKQMAKELFAQLPADVRAGMATADYSSAEARCLQGMEIAKLMAEAASTLA